MVDDELRQEIFSELKDDWLAFDQVAYLVRQVTGDDDLLRRTVDVVANLIQLNIITPGALGDQGFVAWTGTRSELAERVRIESQRFSTIDSVKIGDICWFDLAEDHHEVSEQGHG